MRRLGRPQRSRRSLREMDPGRVGMVGLVATLLLLAVALNIGRIVDLVNSSTYTAEFSEAGGLRSGDDVRIAGITVGSVKTVELHDGRVEVSFGLEGERLGDATRAVVKSDNALGAKFLAIEPGGAGDSDRIPLARTEAGLAVNEELGRLTTTTAQIDEEKLAASFESVSEVLHATPEEFRSALEGVSALSQTLSSRDQELAALLQKASSVSGVLAERNTEITSILGDGSLLFAELTKRREVLGDLLHNVQKATHQLNRLVADNKHSLKPALKELRRTAALLTEYRGTLKTAIKSTGSYIRSLGESVAAGPFFQAYVSNLGSPEDLVLGGVQGLLENEEAF